MEDHSTHGDLGLEHLEQVPGDRLTLTVLVCRQEKLVGVGQLSLEVGDAAPLVGMYDVIGREVVVDVDGVLRPGLLAQRLGDL